MGNVDISEVQPSPTAGTSRSKIWCLAILVLLVVIPIVDYVVPWLISQLATHYGWSGAKPGVGNLIGLIPFLVGGVGMIWYTFTVFRHIRLLPERVHVSMTPAILMTSGPYAYTRNPRYLFSLMIWFGAALLYGSLPVLIAFLVLLPVPIYLVSREEHTLEAAFGDVYRQYKAKVPRWIGMVRR